MIPAIATEAIPLTVTAGVAVAIAHGLGRQVTGFLVVWRSAPCDFHVQDPAADSRQVLTLVPSGTATVRLVML